MKGVVVNREFLEKHQACGWYRRFILETFPKGTQVTKANVKELLKAVKKAKNGDDRLYDLGTQQDIFGTCLNFMLYKVKDIPNLAAEYSLEKTAFAVVEKRFWELWGKEDTKPTAIDKWLEKIDNTEIAGVPVRIVSDSVREGKIGRIQLGHYIFNRKDMVELMKLVKWNIPAKKRKR